MANILAALSAWSATAGSNQPDTSDANTIVADLQQIQATVRGNLATRATIASGSTVDLSTITGLIASVTHSSGTTSISSFGTLSAGMWKIVTFAISGGVLNLVHHATQMIIPGAANIVLTTGDSVLAESLGSGNWKIHMVQAAATFKIGTFTRDTSVASGDVAYTGVGFKPRLVLFLDGQLAGGSQASIGFDTVSARGALYNNSAVSAGAWLVNTAFAIYSEQNGGVNHIGVVASFDADGFTITWTKNGASTGTHTIIYLALR
jgi:hypothetical protein